MIHEFFAVTMTSVYHVKESRGTSPSVVKVALKGKSSFPVGRRLRGGYMVAICKWLMVYVPEGGGIFSFERKVESVNTRWWGEQTSNIVGLFKDLEMAKRCFGSRKLKPCDPRWLASTRQVIDAIGKKHPAFEVCDYPDLRLLDS